MLKESAGKAKVSRGLDHKKLGSGGMMFVLGKGETKQIQFLQELDSIAEYEVHSAKNENDKFRYVPCMERKCPLCKDDNPDVAKTSYRFAINVWNHTDGEVQVLEGGKLLGLQIFQRWETAEEKKPGSFRSRVFDIKKNVGGRFVTYDLAYDPETAGVELEGKRKHDLEEYVNRQMSRFYGTEEDTLTDDDPEPVKERPLKSVAKAEDPEDDLLDSLDDFPPDPDEDIPSPKRRKE